MSNEVLHGLHGTICEAEDLLYIVTHDLKAFAHAMRTIPDWIDEDLARQGLALPVDARENLDMLRDYAYRLDDAMAALTDLSRVGRRADPPRPHFLQDLVTEACARLPTAPMLTCDIACQGVYVLGPENDLIRLFDAVLGNAAAHHDRDFGRLGIAAVPDRGRVHITVADDGPGIPPDQHETIFKPLSTLRPKSETGHAGVGLAIARKVVRSLDGEIAVVPTDAPRGLCLRFDLPLAGTAA